MRYCFLVGCLLLSLAGCESVVELDLPTEAPVLVVNGVLNPDSVMRLDVSSSQSAYTSGAYPAVENATVQLYRDGQYLGDAVHVGRGVYELAQKPQATRTYVLRINAPGYPSVSASTTVPRAPTIRDVQTRAAAPQPGGVLRTVDLSFVLADDANQNDYYYLRAYTPAINPLDPTLTYRKPVSFTFTAPIKSEFSLEDRYFFSDKLFNGQPLTLQLNIENPPNRATYLQVARISKPYYEYVRLLDKQSYRDNVFSIPAPVTNNIVNGLGIFVSVNDTLL